MFSDVFINFYPPFYWYPQSSRLKSLLLLLAFCSLFRLSTRWIPHVCSFQPLSLSPFEMVLCFLPRSPFYQSLPLHLSLPISVSLEKMHFQWFSSRFQNDFSSSTFLYPFLSRWRMRFWTTLLLSHKSKNLFECLGFTEVVSLKKIISLKSFRWNHFT